MADILTQIQDELDMLLNQMQASLAYIKNRAPPAAISGQPLLSSFAEHEAQSQAAAQAQSQSQHQSTQPTQSVPAGSPSQAASVPAQPSQDDFQHDINELARDLILKEQQIEILIANLPGLNTSEREQVEKMKELERQLEEIEGERVLAVREKEALVKRVEEKIVGVGAAR